MTTAIKTTPDEITTRKISQLIWKKYGVYFPQHRVSANALNGYIKGHKRHGNLVFSFAEAERYLREVEKTITPEKFGLIDPTRVKELFGSTPNTLLHERSRQRQEFTITKIHGKRYYNLQEIEDFYEHCVMPEEARCTPGLRDETHCLFVGCARKTVKESEFGFRFCAQHARNATKIMAISRNKTRDSAGRVLQRPFTNPKPGWRNCSRAFTNLKGTIGIVYNNGTLATVQCEHCLRAYSGAPDQVTRVMRLIGNERLCQDCIKKKEH
ncbi:hypothetical protein QP222_05610 [Corynebacterium pyruviciproducens]|uniref:hypothetical protein n=1 Tax=Corynebacterium pyruviciproducens TaxID=598660 RepID=UPI002551C907|nr:hypothetical protein [Corynebacterium pyruviciproducens]MDK6565885.1 hypothetical protein [Corynebacterium pyruviciproducens]